MSSEETPMTDEAVLETVVRQAQALAGGLPGSLSKLAVTVGDSRVEIEWQQAVTVTAAPFTAGPAGPALAEPIVTVEDVAGHVVAAPLVGTFYRSSEPGVAAFVEEGDIVSVGQQLGIVEAMKIMNRIDADRAGRVVKILAGDGEMVEFGQELLVIDPDGAEAGSDG
ncbi:hypothetical protein GCM10027589_16310 [Actinocorallia lasiicapitis]